MTTIKLKRGNLLDIINNSFSEGEPLFSIDTKELFISDGINKYLINRLDFGNLSERPTTNIYGKLYFSTDTNELFVNDGNSWIKILDNSGSTNYPSPTIELTGDVSGSGELTNLNNVTINTTVSNSDKVDSYHASITENPNTVVVRNSEGKILTTTPDILSNYDNEVITVGYLKNILGNINANINIITENNYLVSSYFGYSCSISKNDNILAVGCINHDSSLNNSGCVYIYDWINNNWVLRSKITASDAAAGDYFGSSCSLSSDGNILAVGANYWEGSKTNQGCVYIFDWDGTNWVQRSQITASDAASNDYFGSSCSLSSNGNVLAVGAYRWEGSSTDQGCVYIFDWDGINWVQRNRITANDPGSSDYFGSSCSLSSDGNVLVVGAYRWEGPRKNQGCVYIFDWDGTNWIQKSRITASDATSSDYFGSSCSLSGNGETLAVGAIYWEGNFSNQGCVYIYKKINNTWFEYKKIIGNSKINDYLGRSCSLNNIGDLLVIGAIGVDTDFNDNGAVYTYKI